MMANCKSLRDDAMIQRIIDIQKEKEFYPWSSEPHTASFLFALARLLEARRILELGTYKGFATLHFLQALDGLADSSLVTIDIKDYRSPILKQPEVQEAYTFVLGDSVKVVPQLRQTFDLAFVDTDHTYGHCVAEVEAILGILAPAGVIVLHDSMSFPGVGRAVEHFRDTCQSITLPTPLVAGRERPVSGLTILKRK
jgi:predicted O-methyltransferase YrrM